MHLPATTLEQWRVLLTVVEHGSIAAAADHLGMSHSAVTLAISRVHDALGVAVVDVDGRIARFTTAGTTLAHRARILLGDARAVEELAENLRQGWETRIRIAFDNTFPLDTMLEALGNFAPISRGARVQIREVGASEAEAALHAGSADVVIASRVPDGYLGEPLTTVRLVAVAAPAHTLVKSAGAVSAQQLSRELVIEVRDTAQAHASSTEAGGRWTVSSHETALKLVSRGHGYTWLPQHCVQGALDAGTLKLLTLKEGNATPVTLHMVLAHPKQQGPATRKFTEVLRAHCQNLG